MTGVAERYHVTHKKLVLLLLLLLYIQACRGIREPQVVPATRLVPATLVARRSRCAPCHLSSPPGPWGPCRPSLLSVEKPREQVTYLWGFSQSSSGGILQEPCSIVNWGVFVNHSVIQKLTSGKVKVTLFKPLV